MKAILGFCAVFLMPSCDRPLESAQTESSSSGLGSRKEIITYSTYQIRDILLRQFPDEALLNPSGVAGNWSFKVANAVLGAGQTYSREEGNLKWEKLIIPSDTKKAFIPVLLYREDGETATLLLEGSLEKFEANARN